MNENKNTTLEEEQEELDFDFDSFDDDLEKELAKLQILKEDEKKIANPDALGSVILNEVWNQFGTQIGLDMTDETLIQKYNREHPETYSDVSKKIMQDERYKKANKEMKEQQKKGELTDQYTGNKIKQSDKPNLDHTVSRKELFENERRKQANIKTEDLANKKENLNPTNESLNKSKGAKSVDELVSNRAERETAYKEQNKKANEKIDKSNMSDAEKRVAKEKNNKNLQDKLDANDDLMKEKDKVARGAINKDIRVGAAKQTAKKAGKDALKTMAIAALFDMLKEIMRALVRFFKQSSKSFKVFLAEMKTALHNFFGEITSFIKTGATTIVGTVVTEVFGPIVSLFTKLASLIKQGIRSVGEAISYLSNKENSNKPFSVKIAEVGKIIVAGLVAAGAIFGGEVFEKAIMLTFPAFGAIQIPLLGSLANIIGLFLSSVLSGVIGAIVLNLIDKALANKQRENNRLARIDAGNAIMEKQEELIRKRQGQMLHTEKETYGAIAKRHEQAQEMTEGLFQEIHETSKHADDMKTDIDRLLNDLR